MVTITVSNDIQYSLASQGGIVGSQPFKKQLKLETLSNWKLTEKLNGLKVFTFSVKNDEIEKANIFVERDIYVPLLTPFKGIITSKEPGRDQVNFTAHEDAWHFGRRYFKCHDKARLKYTKDDWYDKLWLRRRQLSIPEKFTKHIGDAFENVPILIKLTDEELKHHARLDGNDILFTVLENDVSIKLKHKIEKWTPSTGELIAWVEFPEIRDSTVKFQMYFDNPDATSQQSTTTFDNFGYNGVWLLENNGTDETSNNNDGTVTGATFTTNGQIAGAYSFDGVDDKIEIPGNASHYNIWRGNQYERDTIVPPSSNHNELNIVGPVLYYSKLYNLTPGDFITEVGINIVTSSGNLRIKLYDHVDGAPKNLLAQISSTASPGTGVQKFFIAKTEIPENGIVYVAIEVDNNTISLKGSSTGGNNPDGAAWSESHTYGDGPTTAAAGTNSSDGLWSKVTCEPASGEGSNGGWISCWFKANSDGESDIGEIIRHEGTDAWGFRTTAEAGQGVRLQFFHTSSGTAPLWRHNVVAPVNLKEWHRGDIVFNKSSIENNATLYLNGELDTTFEIQTTGTGIFDTDGGVLVIGNASGQTETFDGFIDTVKIHSNPPENVADLIKLEYAAESNPDFIVIGQMEHYLEQADIIAKDILESANTDMPIVDETVIPGLIGLWRLNRDLFDSSGNGHDGSWDGTANFVEGYFADDKCAKLDNTNGVVIPHHSDFTFGYGDPFTVSVRIKQSVAGQARVIVGKTTQKQAGPGWSLNTKSSDNKLRMTVKDSGGSGLDFGTSTSIADNKWHQLTWVHKGGPFADQEFYLDGVPETLELIADGSPGTVTNTEPVTFGVDSDSGEHYIGLIDDVRIYNRALTAEEALKLSNMTQSDVTTVRQRVQWKLGDGHSTYVPDLLHLWKFNQTMLDAKESADGYVLEGTEKYTDGKYGQGFDFDGATTLNFGDIASELGDEFTICGWVRGAIASCVRQQDSTNYIVFGWSAANHTFRLDGTNQRTVATGYTNDGEWHHLAVTYKRNVATRGFISYHDGIEVAATTSDNAAMPTFTQPMLMGSYNQTSEYNSGDLDDIRIFSRALTPLEIKRIAQSTGSFIDDPRDDEIPTESIAINFEHKNHLEALQTIAKITGKNLFFDSNAHRVYIKTKGKEIKEKFTNMSVSDPSFKLDNVANIINVIGNDKTEGIQREKTFEDSNTLKYNYEKTVANKQIATDDTLDLIGGEMLSSLKNLTPDLSISTSPSQFNKYDLQVGDILNLSEIKQDLQGKFKIIKITASNKKIDLSLSSETNQTVQTSGNDLASIMSNLINAMQDINITPE